MNRAKQPVKIKQKPVASTSKQQQYLPPTTAAQEDASKRITEFMSEGDKCPICKSDRFINPKLRLLVNKCYHKMCESCIDRLFTLGPEPCPICGVELRKTGFTAQTFEDLGVEKEVAIRKRIARCFNKRQEDFASLLEYNNYLEEVEDITFNLINSVDVPATEAKIKAYQQANAALIAKNQRMDASEQTIQQKQEAREKAERERKRKLAEQLQLEEDEKRKEDEHSLIAQLEQVHDEKTAANLYKKARKEMARKRKDAEEIPEEWARLMMTSTASTDVDVELSSADMYDQEADLSRWYDYSDLFQLPEVDTGYPSDPQSTFSRKEEDFALRAIVSGYKKDTFWERAVRSGVQGLWVAPVS